MGRIALKSARLWWPTIDMAIPFQWFTKGEVGERKESANYSFKFNPREQAICCLETGMHMPVDEAILVNTRTGQKIPFSSFSILDDKQRVQVNFISPGSGGFAIQTFPIEELSFEGYTYDPKEDAS